MDHPLKAFRFRHDPPLDQKGLADLLDVTRETVTRWESGSRKINVGLLPRVSKRTGIAPTELRPDLADKLGMAAE